MRKLNVCKTVETTVEVDVDVDVQITYEDIVEALRYSEDMEELLEEAGFISFQDLGGSSILDSIKLDIIKDLLQRATLDQLEQFQKSL